MVGNKAGNVILGGHSIYTQKRMKPCAIWPAVSLYQTKPPVSPPLALFILSQPANNILLMASSLLVILALTVVEKTLSYGADINLIAAFSSPTTVNVYCN